MIVVVVVMQIYRLLPLTTLERGMGPIDGTH